MTIALAPSPLFLQLLLLPLFVLLLHQPTHAQPVLQHRSVQALPDDECIDDPDYRIGGNKNSKRSCRWISNTPTRRARQCARPGPRKNCPVTCGICCTDNDTSCPTQTFGTCADPAVGVRCPRTCGVCCSADDAGYTFATRNGKERKCGYVAGKKQRKRRYCKGRTKRRCGMSCGKKGCFTPPVGSPPQPPPTASPSTAPAPSRELTFPPVIDNVVDGVLDMELAHRYADFSGEVFSMTNARLLNGSFPGPTIKVSAGDTLRILYKNEMEDQGIPEGPENTYGYMDHTNLHFHGGHVSGELPSDDIRLRIPPGSSYQYQTKFPSTHMPGTHWIHPHVHGAAALHVSNGAALALIVKDPPGTLPPVVEGAREVLMVIQDFDLERTMRVVREMGDGRFGFGEGRDGAEYKVRLVNGRYRPDVTAGPNEWTRWRVVYAGHNAQAMDLRIRGGGCEMVLLAKDGIYIQDFPRPITLAPIPTGGRADLMVRCTAPGTYPVTTFGDTAATPTLLLRVTGPPLPETLLPTDWSPTYPPYLHNLLSTPPSSSPGCSCSTRFGECSSRGPNDPFLGCVNDLPFSPSEAVHSVERGEVVDRRTNPGIHSYHQHVYPFQFVRYSRADQPGIGAEEREYFRSGDWHDVIQMAGLEGDVELRYRPEEHLGLLMLHCHRLTHEDRGMMAWENVYDRGERSCECDARSME